MVAPVEYGMNNQFTGNGTESQVDFGFSRVRLGEKLVLFLCVFFWVCLF